MERGDRNIQVKDVDISNEAMGEWIEKVCNGIKTLLSKRQEHYGNTIGEPVRIVSKLGPLARVKVYVDQKLARLAKGDVKTAADSLSDTVGFAVLMRALQYAQGYKFSDPLDIYIRLNETGDASLIEEDRDFAHEKVENEFRQSKV